MVVLAVAILSALGLKALLTIPIDAIPDLSDIQVIVTVKYPGQAPQVVEDQVIHPLATALLGVPYVKDVRGYSFYDWGMIYLIFEDGTDLYWARSRVMEYLNQATGRLPPEVSPSLGPDATGLGWVYQYVLQSDRHDLGQLRSLQDWYLRYELQSLPGVAEVASVGGVVKQYQVAVDPDRLAALGVPLDRVHMALERSNLDVGAGVVEMSETEYYIRSQGYLRGSDRDIIHQLERVPIGLGRDGRPVLLKQVADISVGPEMRRGIAEWNGQGEVAGGIVVIRYGENALKVIGRVKQRLQELKQGLPEGVRVVEAYDRSALIYRAIATLKHTLAEEMIVVALVVVVFLLHLPSALVAVFTIPAGVLLSFLVMERLGISANIMSLGGIAIAIGVMVDASVVMVENAHKHLEREAGRKPHPQIISEAARVVGPALFFSLLIITVSFLPVFSLQAQEGRLFRPLAYTKTFAMAASALLAVTIIPALMSWFVRGRIRPEAQNPVSLFFIRIYAPLMRLLLRRPGVWLVAGAVITAATAFPWTRLGSEFMPPLNEGDLLYMPTTLPGLSTAKGAELLQQTDRIIKSFPEVHHVFGKIGRAESATDPAPMSMIETTIMLEPDRSKWRPGVDLDSLVRSLDAAVQIPGVTNSWTMPIKTRVDMLATGIKTPVGIKIIGDDLDTLARLGEDLEALVAGVPGVSAAYAERVVGGLYVDINLNRDEMARHGLTVSDVQEVLMSALGGMPVTWTVEGSARYPVNLRYMRERRDDLSDIRRVRIPTMMGYTVALSQIADVRITDGPPMIRSEDGRKTVWVYVDSRSPDIGGLVKRLQIAAANLSLPAGYSLVWSGQFEYMQRATRQLRVIVPLTLAIIFILLHLQFGNFKEPLLVMISLPFAMVGGVWLMYILKYNLSVAVAVGFIALLGLAAETGVVMLVYLDESLHRWKREGRLATRADLRASIMEGAVERVRPKLMTVSTTLIGLVPVLIGTGTGAEVMRRVAVPMVGGLVSSTLLTLLVIPLIYYSLHRREVQ